MLSLGIFQNLLACGEHQRANNTAHLIAYARKAAQPRSTQHIYKKCLDRVINMVGDGDNRVALLLAQLVKPFVAQTAGSHLHRFARASHLSRGVEVAVIALYSIAAGCLLHQNLILVALFATQAEIAVRHTYVVTAVYT